MWFADRTQRRGLGVLSDAWITIAVEAARAESVTLRQIALHIEQVHGQPLPFRLETGLSQ